jgi:ribosome assembly protein 4
MKRMQFCLSGHTKGVTCVKWGGNGLIYTSAQDTTIKVWRASDGAPCRTLSVSVGHGLYCVALRTQAESECG